MNNPLSIEALFGAEKKFYAEGTEYLTDNSPIKIVTGSNGTFEIRETPLGRFAKKLTKVDNLDEVKEGITLKIPRIPFQIFNEMIAWFRFIYAKDKTESTAMVFYNEAENKFFTWIPKQRNAGATSNYDRGNDPEYLAVEAENTLVMVAHSHPWAGTTDPGPSGTDNNDEKEPLLYLIANNVEGIPNAYCSTCPGGIRQKLEFFDIFDNPLYYVQMPKILLPLAARATRKDVFEMFLDVDSVTIPKEWLDKHSVTTYAKVTYAGYGGYAGYSGYAGNYVDDFDAGLDAYYAGYGKDKGKKSKVVVEKEETSANKYYDIGYDAMDADMQVSSEMEYAAFIAGLEVDLEDLNQQDLVRLIDMMVNEHNTVDLLEDILVKAGVSIYHYDYLKLMENADCIDILDVHQALVNAVCENKMTMEEANGLVTAVMMASNLELLQKTTTGTEVLKTKKPRTSVIDIISQTPKSGTKAGAKTKKTKEKTPISINDIL